MSSRLTLSGGALALALTMACSRQSSPPVSPSGGDVVAADAAADGSTLKVTAPALVSPLNDAQQSESPTLTVGAVTAKYGQLPSGVTYRFQVFGPAGAMVADSGPAASVTYRPTVALAFRTRHTWRARAELGTNVGPWSATGSFITSEGGYIRGNEVFDPLSNGVTVGRTAGPVAFTPEGARLDSVSSYIYYQIPITITTGEFAMEVKGLRANAPGDKSKVFGMMEGPPEASDYITNPFRVDIQYRGTG